MNRMVKHFCDMCGKEITDTLNDLYEIDEDDFPSVSYLDSHYLFGRELCNACYHSRLDAHAALDAKLFRVNRQEQDS